MRSPILSAEDFVLIYVPHEDKQKAIELSRILVEEKLVACANIIDGSTSIYQWQGKIEQSQEFIMIFKTRNSLYDRVRARVKELHTYSTPCIMGVNFTHGNQPYMEWIHSSTQVN